MGFIMGRVCKSIFVEEFEGDRYPDLETVQRIALQPMAADLIVTMRRLIDLGVLVEQDGQIIPNPKLMEV